MERAEPLERTAGTFERGVIADEGNDVCLAPQRLDIVFDDPSGHRPLRKAPPTFYCYHLRALGHMPGGERRAPPSCRGLCDVALIPVGVEVNKKLPDTHNLVGLTNLLRCAAQSNQTRQKRPIGRLAPPY